MSIIDGYFQWLKNKSFLEDLGNDVARVSLPFLNRNNDYTEIYIIKNPNGSFTLTDDGETLSELELSGFNFTPSRKRIIDDIATSFGLTIDNNNSICTHANLSELSLKKHMLVQGLTRISDLFNLKDSTVKSLFMEDVAEFFDSSEIRYTSNVAITGKSGLQSQFDFVIPASKNAPERFIRAFNNLSTDNAKILIFNWNDIRPMRRKSDTQLFAFINDIGKDVKESQFNSFLEYDITPVKWSEKQTIVSKLAA